MEKKPYYITTAIAYTSGKPHIGNTYEVVLADAIARFRRMEGYDVRFQTGTDEHGQKIEDKAVAAGVSPKEFVDTTAAEVKRIWDLMNTSYDRFIRTTDADHEAMVAKIFRKLYEQGDIYKGSYEGMYCKECEAFYTESQIVDGKCPDCGMEVHPAKEEAYFFKMSKYADRLIEHIETHPKFIQPESRKNEMMNNFLKPGLQDLCVSRTSFKWGIPVDFDTDHVIYWPIMLMALGVELPKQVFGHPWLLLAKDKKSDDADEQVVKMSKSRGNVIYPDDLVDMFGVDAVRYFVLHEMPFENDGTISWELVVERINSDLANTLGNLVNRTISMSNKYFGGVVENKGVSTVTKKAEDGETVVDQSEIDADFKAQITETRDKAVERMVDLHVADAISEIWNLFKRCNKYIDETEPWVLAKEEVNSDRLATVLYNLVEGIAIGAELIRPFMPETTDKILSQINASPRAFEELDQFGLYPSAQKVTDAPEILFARLKLDEVLAKLEQ